MLITSFEVHIRLPRILSPLRMPQLRAAHEYRPGRGTRINPDVQGIIGFGHGFRTSPRFGPDERPKLGGRFLKPDIRSVLADQFRDLPDDLRIEDRFALRVEEGGDGHAPGALARNAPVRPA